MAKFKSMFEDFKKHLLQALATLTAGFLIGAFLGGAKVISKQEDLMDNQLKQNIQIEVLQDSVDSLALKDYHSAELDEKVDSIYSAVKEQQSDIDDINKTVDRIFQILR